MTAIDPAVTSPTCADSPQPRAAGRPLGRDCRTPGGSSSRSSCSSSSTRWSGCSSARSRRRTSSSTNPLWALPRSSLDNYVEAWTTGNSAHYAQQHPRHRSRRCAIILVLGVAAGFALEVMVWKGRNDGAAALPRPGSWCPAQMILLPLFTLYFQAGLTGTLWPLIITYIAHGPAAHGVHDGDVLPGGAARGLRGARPSTARASFRTFCSIGVARWSATRSSLSRSCSSSSSGTTC